MSDLVAYLLSEQVKNVTILGHHWVYDNYWRFPTDQLLPLLKCSIEFLIKENPCILTLPMWMTNNMKNTLTDSMIKEYITNDVECDEERELLLAAHEKYVTESGYKYRLV